MSTCAGKEQDMTDTGDGAPETVAIAHVFDAPITEVFKAWIDPDEFAAWYGPAGMRTRREGVHIDPREGGRFELTMVSVEGDREFSIGYTIREIRPPELLVLESDPMPHAGSDQPMTVRVQLESLGDQTRMTLTDGPMRRGREQAEGGYHAALAKLDAHLAMHRTP
jgi:uncharacterized protein YndB with AHSA1/START domain